MKNAYKPLDLFVFGAALLVVAASAPKVAVGKLKKNPVSNGLPKLSDVKADNDDASVSIRCKGRAPYDFITCQVTTTKIAPIPAQKTERELTSVNKFFKNADKKLLEEEQKRLCREHKEAKKKENPSRYAKQVANVLKKACQSPSKDDLRIALLEYNKLLGSVCTSKTNTYQLEFEKKGPTTFIANPGPKGACKVVTVSVIEREVSSSGMWKFSQTVASADKDGEICEEIKLNEPVTYSGQESQEINADCEYIRFGTE